MTEHATTGTGVRILPGPEHKQAVTNTSIQTDSGVKRTLDAMADDYSIRARQARLDQGLPAVLTSPSVLNRLAEIISAPTAAVASVDEEQAAS